MLGPSTVLNGCSVLMPPKCRMLPQPSARRSTAIPSTRSMRVKLAPLGSGSGNGAMSVMRSVQPVPPRARTSCRPRLPDAPVSSTGREGVSMVVIVLDGGCQSARAPSLGLVPRSTGRQVARHEDHARRRNGAGNRPHHGAGPGGGRAGGHRRSGRGGKARLHHGLCRPGPPGRRRDGRAAPRRPRAQPVCRNTDQHQGSVRRGGRNHRRRQQGAGRRRPRAGARAGRAAPAAGRVRAGGPAPT